VMTIATIAIAGIPPFAGFFSKDEILWRAFSSGPNGWIFWLIGVTTAGITSFYMFRLWFMTFFGELRRPSDATDHGHDSHGHDDHGHGNEPHESPWIMLAPLVILAALSIGGGFIGVQDFLKPLFGQPEEGAHNTELLLTAISVAVALIGFGFAWFFYYKNPEKPAVIAAKIRGLYTLVYNKYYIDELYGALFTRPLLRLSTSVLWRGIDVGVIDSTVNEAGLAAQEASRNVRKMQSGNLRSYAGWVAIGAAVVIAYMIWTGTPIGAAK